MRLEHFEGFGDAQSREDLHRKMLEVTHWLDHELFALVVSETDLDGNTRYVSMSNAPPGWVQTARDNALALVDPVHTHLRTSYKPIIWNQATYTNVGSGAMWENMAPYGYKNGIAVTYPLGPGRKLLIGIDRGTSEPNATETVTTISSLQLLAAYAQGSPAIESMSARQVSLAPQQQKVMSLVAAGKSNTVIADILGISKDTVAHHVKAVFTKLRVSTRQQAVLEIARLNLIPQEMV